MTMSRGTLMSGCVLSSSLVILLMSHSVYGQGEPESSSSGEISVKIDEEDLRVLLKDLFLEKKWEALTEAFEASEGVVFSALDNESEKWIAEAYLQQDKWNVAYQTLNKRALRGYWDSERVDSVFSSLILQVGGFDLLLLNTGLLELSPELRVRVYTNLLNGLLHQEDCQSAFFLSMELLEMAPEKGKEGWRKARRCRVAHTEAQSGIGLFAPLSDRKKSSLLGPIFRAYQLGVVEYFGKEHARVLDTKLMGSDNGRQAFEAIWKGNLGGIVAVVGSDAELRILENTFSNSEVFFGVIPLEGAWHEAGNSRRVTEKVDLSLTPSAREHFLLERAEDTFGLSTLWIASHRPAFWRGLADELSDSMLGIHVLSISGEVREDKSWIEEYEKNSKKKGNGPTGLLLDLPPRDVIHVLPYLELKGPKFCRGTQSKGCIRLLGRADWASERIIDTAGRRTEGAVFAVGFDWTRLSPETEHFVSNFLELYALLPSAREAEVYALVRFVSHLARMKVEAANSQQGDVQSHNFPSWRILQCASELAPWRSALGPLHWTKEGELVRTPMLMSVQGDGVQSHRDEDSESNTESEKVNLEAESLDDE